MPLRRRKRRKGFINRIKGTKRQMGLLCPSSACSSIQVLLIISNRKHTFLTFESNVYPGICTHLHLNLLHLRFSARCPPPLPLPSTSAPERGSMCALYTSAKNMWVHLTTLLTVAMCARFSAGVWNNIHRLCWDAKNHTSTRTHTNKMRDFTNSLCSYEHSTRFVLESEFHTSIAGLVY